MNRVTCSNMDGYHHNFTIGSWESLISSWSKVAAQISNMMFAIGGKNCRYSLVFSGGRRDQLHQISSCSSKNITHNKVYKRKYIHVSDISAQFSAAGKLSDIKLIPNASSEHSPQCITLYINMNLGIQSVLMQQNRSLTSIGSSKE